ncbi:MAG: hypothetical protein QXG05_08455 [Nitrososphaerota archaeon]
MPNAEVILEKKGQIKEAKVGGTGPVKLLELQTNGIIPTRMRHVIKRYLKKVGFKSLKVEHRMGPNPFAVTLLASGSASSPITEEQMSKLDYLREATIETLNQTKNGYPIHASQADPEYLRQKLAKIEPTLSKIYYSVSRSS